jgi:phenylacetate-CoA ligase
MNDALLTVYRKLPAALRPVGATAKGWYLRAWRYGSDTDRLVSEALGREAWNLDRWKSWQEDRMARILDRAARSVPHYRDYWIAQRRTGNRASWEMLNNWPILGKETLREEPSRFLADGSNPKRLYREQTSGTTGKPLRLWVGRSAVRTWYAPYEARVREWHGVSRRNAWAILGGQPVVPPGVQRPPYWVKNWALNQLYLSANHISQARAGDYATAIRRHGATHLITYPSSAALLASWLPDRAVASDHMRVVIANAEPLLPVARDQLRRAFGCEARETYGMAEAVCAASECAAGSLHLWPEVGWIEIRDDASGQPCSSGTTGRIVCTGFLNPDMPLVRYEVGDRGSLSAAGRCACGRGLPVLAGLEGRSSDLLRTQNGRLKAEKFDWSHILPEWESLIRRAAKGGA